MAYIANWPLKAAVTVVFSAFGWLVGGVTAEGALAGAAVCFALLLGAGWGGFAALCVVFLLTWGTTRLGYAHKQKLGAAEPEARRNGRQVLANVGIASLCAAAFALGWQDSRLLLAAVAALAEAAADTVSSEVGQAFGGVPRLVTTWTQVPVGTDGAVTASGTLAGVVAAIVVALTATASGRITLLEAGLCAVAAIAGTVADSMLGATVERRKFLGNNAVNFVSTIIAAVIAFTG